MAAGTGRGCGAKPCCPRSRRRRRRPWPRRPPSSLLSALVVLVLMLAGMAAAVDKHLFLLPDSDSQVEELVGAESLDRIKTGREPYAVMFYSPTCPHCVHFAPTWTEVAAAMAGTGIHIAAVSCLAEPNVCQREQIHGYPTLEAFGLQDSNAPASDKPDEGVVIKDQGKDKIIAWLKNHYRAHFSKLKDAAKGAVAGGEGEAEAEGGASDDSTAARAPAAEDASDKLSPAELKRRRATDAFTSLRFAMDHDVFLGTSLLQDDALDSLKNLLRALMLLFPGAERRRAFSGILEALEPLEELPIAEWEKLVEKHIDPLVKAEGGSDDYKWTLAQPDAGYTGGLWLLFHLLMARSALASAEDQDGRVQPAFVLGVIHGFVEHFFGCAECKSHFLQVFVKLRPTWEPQGTKGAVLWIWDLHDQVNVRLEKPRWPSKGSCPRCWRGTTPQPDAIYGALIRAYDIRDTHMSASAAGSPTPMDEEDENMAPVKQLGALAHDYVFIGIIALIVLGAAVWKLERKLSMGRKKKRSEGRLVYELVDAAAERV